jgi:hypothetical protein
MRRFAMIALVFVIALAVAGWLSYGRAAANAAVTLCQLPVGTELVHVRFGPQLIAAGQIRPAWTFAYGPSTEPGHEGFQLFMSPTGRLLGSNPRDALERIRALHERSGAHCGGTA